MCTTLLVIGIKDPYKGRKCFHPVPSHYRESKLEQADYNDPFYPEDNYYTSQHKFNEK